MPKTTSLLNLFFLFRVTFVNTLILLFLPRFAIAQQTCTTSEVHTEIIINAPPATVWKILTDVNNYPAWNPYIYEVKGDIKPGKMVAFRMKGSPKERKFSAQILELKTDTAWAWGGGILFFFKAKHYFYLERIDDGHTKLVQGEYWKGWFGKGFGKTVYNDACVNFAKMNEKLKSLAESR